MHVSVLVFENCTSLAMVGPMEILNKASKIHFEMKGEDFFTVELVSMSQSYVKTGKSYPLFCHKTIEEVEKTDLILIPAFDGNIPEQINENSAFIPWILTQYEAGAEVASMCTGAFLLARTGLVDNKSVTTHWFAVDLFKQMFPSIRLKAESIIVDEGRIYSCGGAMSFVNLMIYLVEKFCGKDVAHLTAKVLLIDIHKDNQNAYAIFSTQKNHHDELILAAQDLIEKEYKSKLSLEGVADRLAISKRNFIRRFKKATGNTPNEYLQRVRIESVKKELESSRDSIEQMIQRAGYEDLSSFRKIFKRFTGLTPVEYRKKYFRMVG